ncbi:hypothetical protein V8G54_035340, partial [Vigna mungo]
WWQFLLQRLPFFLDSISFQHSGHLFSRIVGPDKMVFDVFRCFKPLPPLCRCIKNCKAILFFAGPPPHRIHLSLHGIDYYIQPSPRSLHSSFHYSSLPMIQHSSPKDIQ